MSQRVRSALRFLVVIVPALLIASLITLVVPNGWTSFIMVNVCFGSWWLSARFSSFAERRLASWPGLSIAIGSTADFVTHTESLVAAYCDEARFNTS
jgi:predicted membrane metal-binding protein